MGDFFRSQTNYFSNDVHTFAIDAQLSHISFAVWPRLHMKIEIFARQSHGVCTCISDVLVLLWNCVVEGM